MATTKKIKKVETPIDQRETFVSLQKNFADSDLSVEEKLKTLYDLQEADSEIDRIIQLRGELPAEVEALEGEIADLKAEQARMNAVIECGIIPPPLGDLPGKQLRMVERRVKRRLDFLAHRLD